MSFKDSDFRKLVLTAAENWRDHTRNLPYDVKLNPDKIAEELIVNRGFVNQLQTLIASCINEDECSKKKSSDSGIKKVDLFDPFMDDPLNW